ncbi:MAG: cytochrome P450 [Pseudomonadales bacterium]|nr:cytochrome P450 [Pseudomonadales bacterium]
MTVANTLAIDDLPPGPAPRSKGVIPSLRYYLNFVTDPIAFINERFDQYGDIYCARSDEGALFVLRHPEHIQEVLLKRADDFSKTHTAFDSLTQVLGDALLTSDGDNWKRQRRLVQPAFVRKRMAEYAEMMTAETQQLISRWQPNQEIDMGLEMVDLTLRIVCSTLFSYQVSNETDQVAKAMQIFNGAMATPNVLPDWVPSIGRRKVTQALELLDGIIYDMINERRQTADTDSQPNDLLQRLVTAVDAEGNGDQLSAKEIRDQLMTLFLAGHETTSHALTWCWYLLAKNPDVEVKLHEELDRVLEGRAPTYEDLASLPYTEQVIKETMRLYPPAYVLPRRARCDTEVGGYKVPAGSELVIWLYMTHHDKRWYPNPEQFKPERFTPEAVAELPKLAFMPFGAGPRTCIGAEFAMVEARLILAALAQAYRPQLISQKVVQPKPRITLAPKSSVKMVLRSR